MESLLLGRGSFQDHVGTNSLGVAHENTGEFFVSVPWIFVWSPKFGVILHLIYSLNDLCDSVFFSWVNFVYNFHFTISWLCRFHWGIFTVVTAMYPKVFSLLFYVPPSNDLHFSLQFSILFILWRNTLILFISTNVLLVFFFWCTWCSSCCRY